MNSPFFLSQSSVCRLVLILGCCLYQQGPLCGQNPCGGYRLEPGPGLALSVVGPVNVTNDFRVEYTDALGSSASWRLLTNFCVLTNSPFVIADGEFGKGSQRFYRLTLPAGYFEPPSSQTVVSGETALLRALATDPCAPVHYQWQRNGTNIYGATADTLMIPGASGSDAGIYGVVASTTNGTIGSATVVLTIHNPDTGVPYGIGEWPVSRGNHRARVAVTNSADAVWTRLPWRRRDPHPELRDIWVFDSATGQRVTNVYRLNLSQESTDLLFKPSTAPGEYYIYYMPFRYEGYAYGPRTVYLNWTNLAEPAWTNACSPLIQCIVSGETAGLPFATVLEFQAISDFDRFDPMEVVATAAEHTDLLEDHASAPYLLFPEDRRNPIRMSDKLPLRWIRAGTTNGFMGTAARGEFYAFQIGVYAARQSLQTVNVGFEDLRGDDGAKIPATALRCFNLRGTNWLNAGFQKTVNVSQGQIQPLWFGVAVPTNATAQTYRGRVFLSAANAPGTNVNLSLVVKTNLLEDGGDSEIWKHSRLRWLDSAVGLDDEVCPPYEPIQEVNRTVRVLGRQVHVADGGLLDSIQTSFSRSVDRQDAPSREVLSGPMRFVVQAGGVAVPMTPGLPWLTQLAPGALNWEATNSCASFELHCRAKMESDGYVNYRLTLKALAAANLEDIRLEIPMKREIAKYMLGLGYRGCARQSSWQWNWSTTPNNVLWVGDVNSGLHLKLKHADDRWDMYYLPSGGYRDWGNNGIGGCSVADLDQDTVMVKAYTGARSVTQGQELQFNFGLLITPLKVLNKEHWKWRYMQAAFQADPPVNTVTNDGVTVLNIHSGQGLNPYINYPFLTPQTLSNYVQEAHQSGLKVKVYYTIRELSNHAVEFWALRSLNYEVLADGSGAVDTYTTGTSWLPEHVLSHYGPGWQHPLGTSYDAAIYTTGLSRWMNYYVEGLGWLARNVGIDGLYLDGIGYDREVIKRMRKVLVRANPGCLVDFHSGNNLQSYMNLSSVCQYAEHLPYIDSLWFGEYYSPNERPDFWLLEMSGIPFGLPGEMLDYCGNPWRGMLYGMSTRIYGGCNPRPIWKLWDDVGISETRMLGYWDEACPVRTSDTNVLATAYVGTNHTLISLASWAPTTTNIQLALDGPAMGLDLATARLRAPAVAGLQNETIFYPTNPIPVEAAKGWWLVLEPIP